MSILFFWWGFILTVGFFAPSEREGRLATTAAESNGIENSGGFELGLPWLFVLSSGWAGEPASIVK